MAPFLSFQGSIPTKNQTSLYLNLCPNRIFLQRLNGSGCRVISRRKYLSYAWAIKAIFVDFVQVDSSLTSLILLCNFSVNSLCLWTIWHSALSPSVIDVKVQELFASHWCIVEICNLHDCISFGLWMIYKWIFLSLCHSFWVFWSTCDCQVETSLNVYICWCHDGSIVHVWAEIGLNTLFWCITSLG